MKREFNGISDKPDNNADLNNERLLCLPELKAKISLETHPRFTLPFPLYLFLLYPINYATEK